ncbi:MAG: tyrosine--tRNA ligase [Patescibacteria group bacterium]|mgnify:FL=1
MKTNTDPQKIEELLTRGVENVYPNKSFLEKALKSGKQLTLYLGIDPTGPSLHLGHAISLMKLRQFQQLGHKIIMLIGSFTAMIGDPTDKLATRKPLTREQVLLNCKNYQQQAESILDFSREETIEVKYNSEWLDKLSLKNVVELASNFTVQQMLERDMFEKRIFGEIYCPNCGSWYSAKNKLIIDKDGDYSLLNLSKTYLKCPKCSWKTSADDVKIKQPRAISLLEFLYPLMQGYDSVAMDVDGEIGGNDQTFNMLIGRTLMKSLMNKEKFVLTNKLLTDTSGKKMGKSEGNMITLDDSAQDKFGKVMAWTDDMIVSGFELCTFEPMETVESAETRLQQGENPRDLKLELAEAIVKIYHGEKEASTARENFLSMFQKKERPEEIEEFDLAGKTIVEALVKSKLVSSNSEARRNIEQGGVKINDQVEKNAATIVRSGDVIQKGKRFFIKVK